MNDCVTNALINSHALIEFSTDGKILWANDQYLNLMGYQLEEIQGEFNTIFIPEEERYHIDFIQLWESLCSGKPHKGEFKRITKNGSIIWLNGSYNPIKEKNGRIKKILKIVFDITEKKVLAKNLERKNRELQLALSKARAATHAKSVFLANMSHEIRTPLNSIIGITDTLAETILDDQQQSFIEILQKANHQLMTIINDILDLTKVESGEIQLQYLPFDLQKVLDDVVSVLGFRAKEKGLNLEITVQPDLDKYFIGDSDRLRQVLINLVTNSIKFTPQGFIEVHVQQNKTTRKGNLIFTISDSGIGIPKNKHKDIFRAFTQADSTTTRRYGGTGLGLSISQKIVELMEGHLWLESIPNLGSEFYFTANLEAITKEQFLSFNKEFSDQINPTIDLTSSDKKTLNVLIVDDVEDNRNLFKIYLRNTPHQLYFAESGFEALKIFQENNLDVIFMDIQMPGIDGHETTKIIREIEKISSNNPTKIIACTANAFREDVEKSLRAGCDIHLSKPIKKDSLIKVLNSITTPPPPLECAYSIESDLK